MISRIILFCFLFLISFKGFSQEDSVKISSNVVSAKLDRLGNIYFITNNNTLNKYEPNIKRYTKFADLKNGKISSIDVTNPLRIVVFYEDQAVVKFLDINLTEINSVDIRKYYSDGWISLAASSNNNGLWIYDNVNRKLLKLGEQLNVQVSTGDLYLILSKKISPQLMIEYSDELYLCDNANGIFVFDLFGGYKKTIPYSTFIFNQISSSYLPKNYSHLLFKDDVLYYKK